MDQLTDFIRAHPRAFSGAGLIALVSIPVNGRVAGPARALFGAGIAFAFWLAVFLAFGALVGAFRRPRQTYLAPQPAAYGTPPTPSSEIGGYESHSPESSSLENTHPPSLGTPRMTGSPADHQPPPPLVPTKESWVQRHRWAVGGGVAVALFTLLGPALLQTEPIDAIIGAPINGLVWCVVFAAIGKAWEWVKSR